MTASLRRYRTAKEMLEGGVQNTDDMLNIMKAVRPATGGVRTVWTTLMDLNRRTFEIHYRKE